MVMKLLIICSLLVYANAQKFDKSFKEMCEVLDGKDSYREREDISQPMEGDKCTVVFPVAFDDKNSAQRYCEDNVPFHIHGSDFGREPGKLFCDAEASLICKDGWVQMFGRCYQITKEMMTHPDAVKHCGDKKAIIAFMHREALPFRINDYFSRVSQVWLNASEAITNDLIYNVDGGNVLLALDGYRYGLPNIALARVETNEKAMALCEYTPPMNQAESNHLLRRYGEIYYPTLFTKDKAYVRSFSSLQRSSDRMRDHNYCKNVLRPFLQTDSAQSAYPTPEFLELLNRHREPTIIRTSVYSADSSLLNRVSSNCTTSTSKNYGFDRTNSNGSALFTTLTFAKNIWRKDEPKEQCDGASWSTGIVLSREKGEARLEAMSDARYAPIYCQTNFDTFYYGKCPARWRPYYRKERGQLWCHKFAEEEWKPIRETFDGAEKWCKRQGAAVTGFTNAEELSLLDDIVVDASRVLNDFNPGVKTWLGAKRRPQCDKVLKGMNGFIREESHACSRLRVFEWLNGVAQNPPDFEDHWVAPSEPNNYRDSKEGCIELLKGDETQRWNVKDASKKLNDNACGNKKYFICGKEAPIKSNSNV
ncbi:hypothetical protein GCK72_005132 [Caenorhabditis remanei]|uniref:C-type lectin domain-containing protein n=1 Tax=Caenorhabditis remanei TaxID=31234 RepID=A0A6A5HBP2_CAERE|nr:hypothetical protein GCK72_005132 [Caenorhabditis remanei]KAF1765180.1 hypothetical protein GCK72_005132 [Caenorhabditis remanei]